MESKITLSEFELQRMKRILAYQNLSKQRRLAVYYFVSSIAILFIYPASRCFEPTAIIISIPFAMAVFFLGMARLGYYKLFRIIQYLGQMEEKP